MHEAVSLQIPVCNNETKSSSISLSNREQKKAEFLNQGSAEQQLNICVPFAGNWGYFLIHVPRLTVKMYKRKRRSDHSSRNGCYDLHSAQ
jgi:hypothetical protein